MEKSVRNDLRQKSSSKSERKGLQEGSESNNVVQLETVALSRRQEAEQEVAELKMLICSLGVVKMNRIRNKHNRGTTQVRHFGYKVREVGWFGNIQRRDSEYAGRWMLKDGATRQETKRKTKDNVPGCGERICR